MTTYKYDRKILLHIGDGPDGVTLYTSDDEAVVDGAQHIPALYLEASCGMNSYVKLGPFPMSETLIEQLKEKLK